MKTILISLISEQTIPNILIAAHYKPHILWFISTERMEGERKTECIENTLRLKGFLPLPEDVIKAVVDQDSLSDCTDKMNALLENVVGEVEYVVNMTCGNKVMAIVAYEIFKASGEKVSIGYMPLGKNEFMQIFPERKPFKISKIKERLTIEEYLMSYGFKVRNKDRFQSIKDRAISHRDISRRILNNYENLKGVLGFFYKQLGEKRNQKNYNLSATFDRELTQIEREMLDRHNFEIKGRQITKDMTKDEIIYLTGGWFEEHVFNEVYELVQDSFLDDSMMGINIESFGGTSNELDIAFMKDNVFYHIECKTLGEGDKDIIRDEIYKKGAISMLLGKGEKRAIICTTHNQISESLAARAKDYGIEILSLEYVRELKKWMLEKFKVH